MKKTWILVLGMLLMTSAASAAGKWELQLGAGTDVLGSDWAPQNFALGLNVGVGYNFTQNWSLWLVSSGYDLFPTPADVSFLVDEAVFSGRYTFDGKGLRPYLLVGLGSFTQIISGGDEAFSKTNLMTQFGAGLKIPAGNAFSIFAEAKGSLIFFDNVTELTFPINAGVLIGL